MFEISLTGFKVLTGLDLDHFTSQIMRGDEWGTFLKLATIIETSAKRALGLKLGVEPSAEAVLRIEFQTALALCKDARLTSQEAFEFANYVRRIRNHLAHNGDRLDLDIEKLRGSTFFNKYKGKIEAFVSIEGTKITDGHQQHLNALMVGCIAFISLLAKSSLNEEWIVNTEN